MQNISLMSVTESVEKSSIIFGPIHSRRFGVSLGVDLSPTKKQCNFDCLYCELAPAAPVAQQDDVVSVREVIEAIQQHLDEDVDVITLTANGEPTLYPYLDTLIEELDKIRGDKQTLILSNAATLTDEKIYTSLLRLGSVKLSLDAVSQSVFKRLDRPHHTLHVDSIVKSITAFSQEYHGDLFIEILFVRGLNDTDEEIAQLNSVLHNINATRIDIGTIDRPPAYPVEGLSYKELHELSLKFSNDLPVHIASRTHAEGHYNSYTADEIRNTLDKRPLTHEDIDLLFDEASKQRLQELLQNGEIVEQEISHVKFLVLKENLLRKRKKTSK